MIDQDRAFGASIAEIYQSHLVPLIFDPYAAELPRRLAGRPLSHVLELAAGTGVVTRVLADVLPESVAITATDLSPDMLDRAMQEGTSRPVEWRQADALTLPFGDASCDAVVCQFGVMFFADRGAAFAEARRVLRAGGLLLVSVWDRIEENEIADTVTASLAVLIPSDPPAFLPRMPYGYGDLRERSDPGDDPGAESGQARHDRRGRVLPGHTAPERDRGATRTRTPGGDSRCRRCHRAPVRRGPHRREAAGARGVGDTIGRCRAARARRTGSGITGCYIRVRRPAPPASQQPESTCPTSRRSPG